MFRDQSGSQILQLRDRITKFPFQHTAVYFIFLVVWVFALTFGSSDMDITDLALSLMPHVGLFAISSGAIVYPLRYIYVPFVSFTLIYVIQGFIISFGYTSVEITPDIKTLYWISLALNLFAGTVIALAGRWSLSIMKRYTRPHTVDLVVSIIAGAALTTLLVVVVNLIDQIAITYYPEASEVLGLKGTFLHDGVIRSAYGGIVTSALLIGMLQFPRPSDMVWSFPFLIVYPALAVAGSYGFQLHRTLDPVALSAIFAVTLPIRLVVPTMSAGMIMYMLMTGSILHSPPITTRNEAIIEAYSLIGMAIVIFILAMRSHALHLHEQQNDSIHRLNTVRNYAGVGVFSVDVSTRLVNVDNVTQRMLGVPSNFDIATMMRKFGEREQKELRRLMFQRPGETTTLLARLREMPGVNHSRVIRLFLWYERSSSNTPLVYGLVVDVTGEHLQERALKETLAELSMRQDQQKQMFSIISHELRTPASVISMLVDDLNEPEVDMNRLSVRLREATDQLLGVLTDMRQAVNPEKNLPVNPVPFVPADLAESIRNTFEMQAAASSVQIRLRLGDGSDQTVIGDNVRIKQILGNLIRNAIIHSRCSTITLTYRATIGDDIHDRVGVWSITDDGIGIPKAEVERLFQPFQRGGEDARNRADGSGLGLYIVRTSAQLLGGAVTYFPAPEGGAGYHVRLPEPLATKSQLETTQIENDFQIDFGELYVLLAEDNALVAEVTSARLRKFMGRVEVVGSGREALDKIAVDPPDLVITDLFMPEMSGDELTRALRKDGFDKPIVGLTAAVVGDDMRRFESAGASTIMTKPLDDAALMRFLRNHAAHPPESPPMPVDDEESEE